MNEDVLRATITEVCIKNGIENAELTKELVHAMYDAARERVDELTRSKISDLKHVIKVNSDYAYENIQKLEAIKEIIDSETL